MEAVWSRIEAWLRRHAPDLPLEAGLPPGATESEFAAAEQATGVRFPTDLAHSYRSRNGGGGLPVLPHGNEYFSLGELVSEWRRMAELAATYFVGRPAEPEGPIRPVQWDSGWLPVGGNSSGDFYLVDLSPAPGGRVGQVIRYNHEVGPTQVVAPGFGAWLRDYADGLEAARYRYDLIEGSIEAVNAVE